MSYEYARHNQDARRVLLMLAWIWRDACPIPNKVFRMLHGYLHHPIPRERPDVSDDPEETFRALQTQGIIPADVRCRVRYERADFWSQYTLRIHERGQMALYYWYTAYPEELVKVLSRYNEFAHSSMCSAYENSFAKWSHAPMLM